MLKKWEKLPPEMQTEEVKKYYDILKKKKLSLFFKRVFDIVVSLLMLIILSPVFLILAKKLNISISSSFYNYYIFIYKFRQKRI